MLMAAVVRQQGPDSFGQLLPQLVAAAAEGPMQVRGAGRVAMPCVRWHQQQPLTHSTCWQGSPPFNHSYTSLPPPNPPTPAPPPPKQAEISCLVLQFMAEDITQFEERTGDWRRSFLAALLGSVDAVLPFLVQVRVGGGFLGAAGGCLAAWCSRRGRWLVASCMAEGR
jgi:hypothetical protein